MSGILERIAQTRPYLLHYFGESQAAKGWLPDLLKLSDFEIFIGRQACLKYCPECGERVDWQKIKQGAYELRAAGEAEFEQRERVVNPASKQEGSDTVSRKGCQNEKNPPPCPAPAIPCDPELIFICRGKCRYSNPHCDTWRARELKWPLSFADTLAKAEPVPECPICGGREFEQGCPLPADYHWDRVIQSRNALGSGRGFSGCMACDGSWIWKPSHSTDYNAAMGCFPLCEECWAKKSVEERLPFYRALVHDMWQAPEYWPEVEAAVLAGK